MGLDAVARFYHLFEILRWILWGYLAAITLVILGLCYVTGKGK